MSLLQNGGWMRREEEVAATPGVVDIGVGDDACRTSGMDSRSISFMFVVYYHDIPDGGAGRYTLHSPQGDVSLYAFRRKRHLDVGTRLDCRELGIESLCDLLDTKLQPEP